MELMIDRTRAARILSLDWSEIILGIKDKWLDPGVAVDFAIKQLELGVSDPIVLDLAACDYVDTMAIHDDLERLEKQMPQLPFDNKKWAMIMLAFGYEYRSKLSDFLQFVEQIYADFGYPKEISHLVRYMPAEGPPRNLVEDLRLFIHSHVYDALVSRNPE